MDQGFPKRKNIRLQEYDYNSAGACFVTFCTYRRRQCLCRIVGATHESPVVELTAYGQILENVLRHIPARYSCRIDKYVIMPNHVHLLISVSGDALQRDSDISQMIGYIKMNTSKQIHEQFETFAIWQQGFYDHVIRNQSDYDDAYRYIENNPLQWELDELYTN